MDLPWAPETTPPKTRNDHTRVTAYKDLDIFLFYLNVIDPSPAVPSMTLLTGTQINLLSVGRAILRTLLHYYFVTFPCCLKSRLRFRNLSSLHELY